MSVAQPLVVGPPISLEDFQMEVRIHKCFVIAGLVTSLFLGLALATKGLCSLSNHSFSTISFCTELSGWNAQTITILFVAFLFATIGLHIYSNPASRYDNQLRPIAIRYDPNENPVVNPF